MTLVLIFLDPFPLPSLAHSFAQQALGAFRCYRTVADTDVIGYTISQPISFLERGDIWRKEQEFEKKIFFYTRHT